MSDHVQQARELLEQHVVGKKTDDFLMLSPTSRHFLFQMRMYLDNEKKGERPFTPSEKQVKFLRDVLESVKLDGGESKKVEQAFAETEREIRAQLSKIISKEGKKLAEKLGVKHKAVSTRLRQTFEGRS